MGKTRDHFKKISDTKGTFHAKMDKIKDRNGMDPKKQKWTVTHHQKHISNITVSLHNFLTAFRL